MFATYKLPKRVRLGVANQHIVVRQLDMPLIQDAAERDAAVRFQAADAIAMPLDDVVLDYVTIGAHETPDGRRSRAPAGGRGPDLDALLPGRGGQGGRAQARRGRSERVRARAHAGWERRHRRCRRARPRDRAPGRGHEPRDRRRRPLPVHPPPPDRVGGRRERGPVRRRGDPPLARLLRGQPRRPPDRVRVLAGPGAEDDNVREALQQRTGLEVSIADPLGPLGTHTVPSLDDPFRYTVAAGLATGSGRHEARQPASRQRAPPRGRPGAPQRLDRRARRARAAARRRGRLGVHEEPGQRQAHGDRRRRAGEGRGRPGRRRASRHSATSARSSRPACRP